MEAVCQSCMSKEGQEEANMNCKICDREATSTLCRYHEEAKQRINSRYQLWVKAYGRMEWKDYLDKVKRNDRTGQWAKEIAEMMLEGLRSD